MKITKKLAITLSAAMMCSIMSTYAAPMSSTIPVGCPLQQSAPCQNTTQCEDQTPCNCGKPDCPKCCEKAPVFNSCEEIQEWKTKYFEKRCEIYTKLGLSQEQRVKAKTVDEKFFDEIAPLKMCCKQEKAKLEEMKCKKCSWKSKREQKQKIKDLKSEIKDKKKQHKECFEKLLNQCQKDAYKKLSKHKGCGC